MGPLWLNSTWGDGVGCLYSSDRQVQPGTEPSVLALSAYTLVLITPIHMALLKNLGTDLGQIKFTRHSRVAPCLWGDGVTVLQACESWRQGRWAANLKWPSPYLSISMRNISSFTELHSSWPIKLSSVGCTTKAAFRYFNVPHWGQPTSSPSRQNLRIPLARVSSQLRQDRQP